MIELEDLIRKYLRNWEDSDLLPSEAAKELMAIISSRLLLVLELQPIKESTIIGLDAAKDIIRREMN